jgi:hypothetical protein
MNPLPRTLLIAVAVAAPAWSAPQDNEQYSRLPESVLRVERETGGKVLQVMPIQRGDREVYRMKVLTPEGRVRVVHDDPRHPREPAADDGGEPRNPVQEHDRDDALIAEPLLKRQS